MYPVKYEDTVFGVLVVNTEPFLNPVIYLLLLLFTLRKTKAHRVSDLPKTIMASS